MPIRSPYSARTVNQSRGQSNSLRNLPVDQDRVLALRHPSVPSSRPSSSRTHLNQMTGRCASDSCQPARRIRQSWRRRVPLAIISSSNGTDPSRVSRIVHRIQHGPGRDFAADSRIDNSATDRRACQQPELLCRLLSQAATYRLTSGEDQTVLARGTANLIVVSLHQRP